ncbi:MAG TPA: hypothetical protein DDW52_03905 [Planctomycetaceae bacterium]|nr:hypothetical protein [Planctomycetaceae bacterium]
MALTEIPVPDTITQIVISPDAERLIDFANERIEAFMLGEETVSENFVPCDFHLLDQALTWIEQGHLLAGNRFCELGSGFGVAALLAAQRGLEAVGIEVETNLVEQACRLAETLKLSAEFYTGSFVPREISGILDLGSDIEHVETFEGDVYNEIGLEMDEFDLFFAFPWPGEHQFFEAVFQAAAADNALLLTYRGRDGMHLLRKV